MSAPFLDHPYAAILAALLPVTLWHITVLTRLFPEVVVPDPPESA